ncbi:peptidylprolyl isomerase fpr4 [Orbilia brochopaga]|uniref:peptidylprolyl isomerase n=1 Tax=Orbilia brochopaga TaxID=3140254 RepID=A0AAV9UHX9_9PEZI
MSSTPIGVWSLKVPATGEIVALEEMGAPFSVSITMAAIDPTEEVKGDGPKLSTLHMLHPSIDNQEFDDDDDESIDSDLASGGEESDDDSEDDEEEDDSEEEEAEKSKSKKDGKKDAAKDSDKKTDKKADKKADAGKKGADEEEDEDDIMLELDDSDDEDDIEDVVVCTLDPTKTYQQPLQLSVADGEPIFFKATGAYTIYLTGNFIAQPRSLVQSPYDDDSDEEALDDEDEEEDSELDSDEEGIDLEEVLAKIKNGEYPDLDDSDASDDLDDLEDPRITELGSDDDDSDEAPTLVKTKKPEEALSNKEKKAAAKAAQLKAKAAETAVKAIVAKETKKRSADEMDVDVAVAATTETLANGSSTTTVAATATVDTPPSSLSKKQQKKLKANSGEAVAVSTPTEKKKVQFASQLEQGPTPNGNKSPATPAEKSKPGKDDKPSKDESKSSQPKTRTVDGVKIEDHKLGSGPEAKKGNKVSMRYIGKLTNGKVFDSNKKGKPFTFTLGKAEVIKGWDIGVAGMKVGGERKLTIPANLAYGNSGMPGIPKNSTLIFEVKLLEIK